LGQDAKRGGPQGSTLKKDGDGRGKGEKGRYNGAREKGTKKRKGKEGGKIKSSQK